MAAAKKLRTKREALPALIHSRDDAVAGIKRMGDLLRLREQIQGEMNDSIAQLQEDTAARVAPIDEELAELEAGIAAYCTTHRDVLTDGNKVKFADLITGKVSWRNNPPKVVIRGVDAVIALMEQCADFSRFIRVKKEINKDAVLNEAALFEQSPVPGLSIVPGKEQFVIEPYNQELPACTS
ncbi:MAG: host-nuclease inhibitor Gam family protein [Snodgrassella sp.]|uniref:host-nuclease inhibitor Gam family protein n=1 Tax=Snodgrassella sp. TaxID=2815304 RepID=UPI00258F8996|nr:host-nuclease inhibitor Gam family protein [Snodgrassella sp.]MCO6520885.1 host-nuclease inhibitor Gam family protein [Snodgrassella sp.]